MAEFETTTDGFLNGTLTICQPKFGFRAGSDAVLLAASVNGKDGQTILDVGCGVGTAGLCAIKRLNGCQLWGVELQSELAGLAEVNAAINSLTDRTHFIAASIAEKRVFKGIEGPRGGAFLEVGFDHVITNPPFYEKGRARAAATETKTLSHIEGELLLEGWLRFCVARTKPKGKVSVIHRADRLGDIINALSFGCGRLQIIPLWPDAATPAKRVIVRGIKGDRGPLTLDRGLVLHQPDGSPTPVADQILREGRAFEGLI